MKFRRARYFYEVVIFSTLAGIALDFLNVNPIKALYWTAILNGLLAPFLLIGIVLVASDRNVMAGQPSSRVSLSVVLATALLMFAAALGLFVL